MSNFTIKIRHHYTFSVEVIVSLTDLTEGDKVADNQPKTLLYTAQVINPPGSFWDTRRIFETQDLEQLLFEVTLALEESVAAQIGIE